MDNNVYAAFPGMSPSVARDHVLTQWRQASDTLAAVKKTEADLRQQVIAMFSERTDEMASGVENVNVGWGKVLKIEHNLKYELDNVNDFEKTDAALDAIEKLPNGELLVDRLVKRKLEISVSEYKKLPNEAKAIIDRVLTIKPASKAVKLVDA